MQTTIGRLAFALLLTLTFGTGGVARAEDEAEPLGAAEQAYKDAWWAETGGGNLNEALALYEKAAAAEGPASVKAKALYRRAVIQQRIGKTQEAIQTLERLAKEHPGEAEVQSDARARLAEWTAVDLRTGFPEWYRRFQYGPEFQSKILDLVLKLGGNTDADVQAARQELLTIGEPSIPALRAHLGTRNSRLAGKVVDTLLQFGEVPDEIVGSYGMWTTSQPSWALIMDLPPERRATLLLRLGTALDSENALTLQAALQGPAACVESLARLTPPPPDHSYPQSRWRLQGACLGRVEAGGALGERVRALVAAGVPDPQVWQGFARWLIEKGLVTRADVDAWARLPWETAATVRVQAVRNAKLFQPVEALQVLSDVIAARPGKPAHQHSNTQRWLLDALMALLPELPWPESREEVARVLGPLWLDLSRWGDSGGLLLSDRLLEAFGRAFELAREPALISAVGDTWMQHGPGRPGGLETLFGWAREGALAQHRATARSALFPRLGEHDLDAAVDLLVKPETVDDDVVTAWSQLFRASPQVGLIVGSPARMWRLLDRIAAVPQTEGARARNLASHLLAPVRDGRASPAAVLDLWLEQPDRFPIAVFALPAELNESVAKAGQLPALRRAFRERWTAGIPAQREGLLAGLSVLDPRADPELLDFLRAELAAQPRRIPATWRGSVIARLLKLTVADIRAFYDLTQPEQVDEAAGWVTRTQKAPILEATPEAFEALRLAFRPDSNVAEGLGMYFREVVELKRPLAALLLAHSRGDVREQALPLLVERASPEDADLWIAALKDSAVPVRTGAAAGLVRVPTAATIKALVAALDDPHPDVRAAALESLDSIQKMEDLKARWREKVK